jgi:hypothetical protein
MGHDIHPTDEGTQVSQRPKLCFGICLHSLRHREKTIWFMTSNIWLRMISLLCEGLRYQGFQTCSSDLQWLAVTCVTSEFRGNWSGGLLQRLCSSGL